MTLTGVYKAQCAGDRGQVHLHGNKETGERMCILTNKLAAFDFFLLLTQQVEALTASSSYVKKDGIGCSSRT